MSAMDFEELISRFGLALGIGLCWGSSAGGGRAAALHRRHGMVSQVLHEHAASLSAASHANRSRRLTNVRKILDTTTVLAAWGAAYRS
jgi:hypothetical protein